MKYLVGIPVVAFIVSIILNVIVAGVLALTYKNLSKETPIVKLTFEKIGDEKYEAHLRDYEDDNIGDYLIYGDQWLLDAYFYKMSYLGNVLGVESKYTLDRFKGRYEDIDEANNKKSIAYEIEGHRLIDLFSFFFDTEYGTSTYKNINPNILYTIYKTPTGIIVREKPIDKEVEKGFLDKARDMVGL